MHEYSEWIYSGRLDQDMAPIAMTCKVLLTNQAELWRLGNGGASLDPS